MPFRDRIPTFSVGPPRQSRLPMLGLPDTTRNNITAVIGELVGTFLFIFWALVGAQIANTPASIPGADPRPDALLYNALSCAFSLMVNLWIFYRITGGLFNPSVWILRYIRGIAGKATDHHHR